MVEDRIIETVGDLRLALEGIEDDAPLYLFPQIGSDKKHNVEVQKWGRTVVLRCVPVE